MKIYTISELELFNKEELRKIIFERSELCSTLIKNALLGKKIDSNMGKPITKNMDKLTFPIKDINYHKSKDITFDERVTIIPINVYLEGYLCENNKESMHYDELTSHKLRTLIEKHVNEDCRIHWGEKKLHGLDYINMDLLFPTKLINPDILAYEKYAQYCKKNKKSNPEAKEKKKKEIQNELNVEVNELKDQRFNLVYEDHLYIPSDRKELMELIKKINKKTFDLETLTGIVKKYPDDEEIVYEAIGGFQEEVFKYASNRLKNDEKFINRCLDNNRVNFLEFVGKKFKDNEEIIRKAINISGYIIRVASNRLKNDKALCLDAVESQADAFLVISKEIRKDKDLIDKIIEKRGEYFCICPEVKTNKYLLIKAFSTAFDRQSHALLQRTSEEFRNDKQVALAAIKCNSENINYIGKKLRAEIGDFEPITYLSKIDLYNEMNQQVEKQAVMPQKKFKM